MKKIINKKVLLINLVLVLIGVLFGISFIFITNSLDKLVIKTELTSYIELFTNYNVTFKTIVNSFLYNFIYIFIITLSGTLYIFSPLILFVNFYKGMLIGFLISSLVYTYKLKGLLYSLVMLFPHHIIMTLLIIVYSSVMLYYAYKLAKITKNNGSINIKSYLSKTLVLISIASLICLICTLLELYLNPLLVKLIM